MKIQCTACEAADAKVLCCADDAALCLGCDEKVHAANNIARKHRRVPLSSSSSRMPKCDICQETIGNFFCLEDRALLCRKCDVAIHTGSSRVSGHQRFLLTGVKVGLEATELGGSSSKGSLNKAEKVSSPCALPGGDDVVPSTGQFNEAASGHSNDGGSRPCRIPEWHLEEYYGSTSNLY